MTKLIHLDKEPIVVDGKVVEYLTPDVVYVPFPRKKEDLKKEKEIKKGSFLYPNFYAPISGKLKKIEDCLLPSGKWVHCLVYENDFQEKQVGGKATRKKISTLSKEEMLESILDTRLKEKLERSNPSLLLISGIEDEPYIENESIIGQNHTKMLVDMIEALLSIYPNTKAYIALKNTDSKTIMAYQNILGMYKNIEIKFVEDLYLIGQEYFLTKYLHMKEPYLFLKVSELYELYLNIKGRKPLTETFITFSGNGCQKPIVIKAKIGTKVTDLFFKFFKEDLSNCVFFVNGMMQGKQMDLNYLIVTKDLKGILMMKKQMRKKRECIKCGKCILLCPKHANPLMAYQLNRKITCMNCGLCTYICPSNIPLYQYVKEDNE